MKKKKKRKDEAIWGTNGAVLMQNVGLKVIKKRANEPINQNPTNFAGDPVAT